VALGGSGVYRSNDGGVNWTRIDNGVNSITGLASAVNVKLAVSRDTTQTPAVTVVYAAVAYAAVPGASQQLTSVFRSTDAGTSTSGANWRAMARPGTTTTVAGNTVFIGVNPGGQARINLAFTADPANPNIVYIGGDRQPTSREEQNTTSDQVADFPNSIGATGYNARLFRGDASQAAGSQWTPITDNFADVDGVQAAPDSTPRTSPHSDSRSLAFTPNGSLLETDDGGIYRNNNPKSAMGVWNSVNGNLGVSELTGVGYDPLNNVIIAGAQDNGTAVQSASSDRSWREIRGGDGGLVQVDSTSTQGNSTYFYTAQQLRSFSRQTRDSTNALVGTPTFLALRVVAQTTLSPTAPAVGLATTTTLTVTSAAQFPSSGTFMIVVDNETMTVTAGAGTNIWTVTRTDPVAHDPGAPIRLARASRPTLRVLEANYLNKTVDGFYLPYVLNKVNPKRMLLGTTVLYESGNQGDDFIYPNGLTSVGSVTALAYGGYLQTDTGLEPAPDVAYVGTAGNNSSGNRLFLRQVANGQFNPVAGYPGSTPRAIVLDPSDWKTVYVLDSNSRKVYRTLDATAANPIWQDITGNLTSTGGLGVTGFRSIEIIGSGANAGIFIGARGGVYATDNVQGSNTSWVRFGTGLPNVQVTGLVYNSTDNVLVVGTIGRGAWLVRNASSFVNQQQIATEAPTWTAPTSPVRTTGTTPVVFSTAKNDLRINDPAGTAFEQVSLAVSSGQLRLADATGLSFLLGNAAGGSVLTFAGTLSDVNAALNGLTYTPANVSGEVTLAISVDDLAGSGKLTAAAAVPIIVTAVNDAPVNTVPAGQFVKTNSNKFSFSTATGNAIAIADGDSGNNPLLVTLTVTAGTLLVNYPAVKFTAGASNTPATTLTFSGTLNNLNAALQTLTYTPPANFQGTATLTVTTNDQGGTSPGGTRNDPRTAKSTVSITVTAANLAPVIIVPAVAPTVPATDVGAPGQLAFTGANAIQIRDDDAGSNPVTVNLSVNQGSLTVFGNTFANGDTATATDSIANINTFLAGMTYTPLVGFRGPVTLTITVNDNGNTGPGGPQTATATVTINVGSRTPPAVQAPAEQSTTQGARLTFSSAKRNNITVSIASTEVVNLEVTVTAAHGTVTLHDPSKLFFTVGDGTADRTMTFSGSPLDINKALDGLVYVPDANFRGSDHLTVTVTDPEERGDLTPQPPNDVEEDGGDDGGDPPPTATDPAGASSSSDPPPAPLLSATRTVLIHVNAAPTVQQPPSVSVAFGPAGEVMEVVNAQGVLTQFDASGAHTVGGGVRAASVAFGPAGWTLLVTYQNGTLEQYDASGAHVFGGGVLSASLTFGPSGEVIDVVTWARQLIQCDAAGAHVLGGGVVSASVAFGPSGEVTDVVTTGGVLIQFDASGAHVLGGGVASAGVAFGPAGEVTAVILLDGSLWQFDPSGAHRLGTVS
jgi:hypothetical protein